MTIFPRLVATGLMLAVAAPALAQATPPAGAPMMRGPDSGSGGGPGDRRGGWDRLDAFPSMSEAGRTTMMTAMRDGGDRKAEREGVRAARDRMLAILEADRFDANALKRAMDDERNAANASRERHQAAMLAAFGKLSVADRKAFVVDSRAMKSRMEERMQGWRGRHGGRGGMQPPPPPM